MSRLLLMLAGMMAMAQSPDAVTSQPVTSAPVREAAPLAVLPTLVECELRLDRTTLSVGSPVMGEFILRNRTLDPVTLQVPATDVAHGDFPFVGLPLEHVFSGDRFRCLRIVAEGNNSLGDRVVNRPDYPVPMLTLAPLASVGLRFDLTRFYPVLHQQGRYEITWMPYGGALSAAPVVLEVVTQKMVVMETSQGRLTFRLLYDKAPKTIANFLELVRARFYDGKTFHRVEPNFAISGGCPLGNGTGRRPDGRTIAGELNDTPFTLGTVGMSLIKDDPNSGSCQFFVALARHEFLDGHYTAFAQIEGPESLDTLRKMSDVQLDTQGRPVQPLTIKSAAILDAPVLR
ncbi:MAG: peptidylprolyl isomerase [Phycisphaerae bacterium]